MGASCCVAARDRTIEHGSSRDIIHRHAHRSPSWSVRWDNRGRVAGEETSLSWLSDGISRSGALDSKSVTDVSVHSSITGRVSENDRTAAWCKSAVEERTALNLRIASGQSISTNISLEVEPAEHSQASDTPFGILSSIVPSTHSTPLVSTEPLSLQRDQLLPASTPPRWTNLSPWHNLSQQASDSQSSGRNSPINKESSRGSCGRSSDAWSIHAFSELVASASRRGRRSFDSESFSFSRDKASSRSNVCNSASPSNLQNCGICSRLLIEISAWSSQKFISNNELAVVAVLICGHVYHAECLENITSDTNKYDPACPVCTFGQKQTLKMTNKLLKAEESKARNRKSRSRVADTNGSVDFDYWRGSESEGKHSPKLTSSFSLKSLTRKHSLKRHFSLRSKGNKSEEASSSWRKGLFWAKFSRG